MSLIYLAARVYPYWATAVIVVMMQLTVYFRRKRQMGQWYAIFVGILLAVGILAWFAFGGYLHSDEWVRFLIGQ